MVQIVLERVLSPAKLNALFERTAVEQYTRELLFSTVFELMNLVVFKTFPSVNAAYQENREQIGVSIASVYNKLNGLEARTSAALVRETASEKAPLIEAMGAVRESWLPGYRIKVLDGNCIEATEHRLEVLRETAAGALPGKSLVVYDPALEMAVDVLPCEDGHAQERALLGQVLSTVRAMEVWLMDRNFCVRDFICGIEARGAYFISRQHQGLSWEALSTPRYRGQTQTGKVYEQRIQVVDTQGKAHKYRRLRVSLNKPTRDGEAVVKAALRTVHGDEMIDNEVSGYYLAGNIARTYDGMMIAVAPKQWAIFHTMAFTQLAQVLLELAANVKLSKFRKHRRGPKKPRPKRDKHPDKPHVSTAKLLAGK